MRIKLKTIIIIFMIVLSYSLIYWNFDLKAKSLDNEMNRTPTSRSNNYHRAGNFDWEQIEVISEPIIEKNFNIALSESPKIAVENDKIYVVWSDKNNTDSASDDWDIFFRYFDGSKWSKIQVISEPVQGKDFNADDSNWPDISVEDGKIYVVWQDCNNTNNAGGDYDIFYRCNLSGNGWEPVQVISEPVPGKNFNTVESYAPSIAVENDKIYVAWCDKNNTNNAGSDFDIFYRCNLTGSSWEPVQVISELSSGQNLNTGDSYRSKIAVENSKIYVVWEDCDNTNNADVDWDIFYRCNLTGFSWEPVQVISEPLLGKNFSTEESYNPAIAIENDNIYVVWEDENNTNGASTDRDIFYRCNLTGSNWENIQVISEPVCDQNFNTGGSIDPVIAVENGKIYTVWSDTNNTNSAGLDFDIFYKCNFTGTGWEDIHVISEPILSKNYNTFESRWPDIAINRGKSCIVWRDDNITNGAGTDWDIFYKSISLILGLGPSSVTPIYGNTSTDFTFKATYFNLENKPPTEITVKINSIEYLMSKVDPIDTNYIDGKDYFFDIKNLDIGVHTHRFYASDDINTIITRVFNGPMVYNTPPKITTTNNITAIEDNYYEIIYEYEDIDKDNIGQLITWNFSTNATWLSFNPTTAILYGTPTNDDVGIYWVNIKINDTIEIETTNFTLTVINVNDAPVIITNNIEMINEDEYYEISYNAIDVDTPQVDLNWAMNTNASWLEYNTVTAMLNGTPDNDNVGTYWINISVSDTEYIDFTNFTLTVIGINDAPEIITENIVTATEDVYYEVDYEALDVDNDFDELIWDINTNANWLVAVTLTAIINGTPRNDDVGEYWVYISVKDNEFIDEINFTLTVLNTNDPPMINTDDITTASLGELYSVNYEASDIDPNGNVLTWSLNTNAGEWLTIDSNSGWLNGIPSEGDAGEYWVNITVNDGEGGNDFHNFTITIESLEDRTSQEETTWYILILIVIILIIITLIISLFIYKKRKAAKIPTVRAELLHAPPEHMALPSVTAQAEGAKPLPQQPVVSEQLTTPKVPVPTLAPKVVKPQYQLPQATLSKAQKLGLLEERFLRGEVTEETYKELKAKIQSERGEELTEEVKKI